MVEPPRPATDAARAAAAPLRLVCFRLHGQEYGVAIDQVKETIARRPITRVFLTPSWLAGIMNLRGDVVAVIDLGAFLGVGATVGSDASRIVVVRHGALRCGVLVDDMADVRTIASAAVQPPPPTIDAELAALMRGLVTVAGGAVRVLDVANLLESERVRALQRGGQ